MKDIEILQKYIDDAKNIVFFGGAGVSTASGIKDFRSVDGLYNEKYDYPPEEILSHEFFINNTKEFYRFYKDKLNTTNVLPNVTHNYLKELESRKRVTIITQNIDGLHEKSGSSNVLLLHGTTYSNHCMKCNKWYDYKYVFESIDIPTCTCGGIIKPDVVLYNEPLDDETVERAIKAIKDCDLLIVAGTSLLVYPAASYIRYFNGKHLVIINKEKTSYDGIADLVINKDMKEIFRELK